MCLTVVETLTTLFPLLEKSHPLSGLNNETSPEKTAKEDSWQSSHTVNQIMQERLQDKRSKDGTSSNKAWNDSRLVANVDLKKRIIIQ